MQPTTYGNCFRSVVGNLWLGMHHPWVVESEDVKPAVIKGQLYLFKTNLLISGPAQFKPVLLISPGACRLEKSPSGDKLTAKDQDHVIDLGFCFKDLLLATPIWCTDLQHQHLLEFCFKEMQSLRPVQTNGPRSCTFTKSINPI